MTVSELFRAARTNKGLSLEAVARETGLSISTVTRTEGGKLTPKADTLFRIADALGVDYTDLRAAVGESELQAV